MFCASFWCKWTIKNLNQRAHSSWPLNTKFLAVTVHYRFTGHLQKLCSMLIALVCWQKWSFDTRSVTHSLGWRGRGTTATSLVTRRLNLIWISLQKWKVAQINSVQLNFEKIKLSTLSLFAFNALCSSSWKANGLRCIVKERKRGIRQTCSEFSNQLFSKLDDQWLARAVLCYTGCPRSGANLYTSFLKRLSFTCV